MIKARQTISPYNPERGVESGLKKKELQDSVDRMKRRGLLFEPEPGFVKRP